METRTTQHSENNSTNYIFEYFNSWSRYEVGTFGPPAQGCIFGVWHRDPNPPQISEALTNMLCSAHISEGTFNATGAGGFSTPSRARDGYSRARAAVFAKRPHVPVALEADLARLMRSQAMYQVADIGKVGQGEEELRALREQTASLKVAIDNIDNAADERRGKQQERDLEHETQKQVTKIKILSEYLTQAQDMEDQQYVMAKTAFDAIICAENPTSVEFPSASQDPPFRFAREVFSQWQSVENEILSEMQEPENGQLLDAPADSDLGTLVFEQRTRNRENRKN